VKGRKQQDGIAGMRSPGGIPAMSNEAEAAILRLARLLGRQMAREAFEARQRQGCSPGADQDPASRAP